MLVQHFWSQKRRDKKDLKAKNLTFIPQPWIVNRPQPIMKPGSKGPIPRAGWGSGQKRFSRETYFKFNLLRPSRDAQGQD